MDGLFGMTGGVPPLCTWAFCSQRQPKQKCYSDTFLTYLPQAVVFALVWVDIHPVVA